MGEPAIQLNEMEATTADRIKYIVNGETRWYTLEELKEHIIIVHKSVDIVLSEEDLEKLLNRTLGRLEEYDGDPFGHIKYNKPVLYELVHMMDAAGRMHVIR